MKYVCITVVSAVIVALIAVSLMFVSNRAQRETELDNAVNSASREALEECCLSGKNYSSREEGDKALYDCFYDKLQSRVINGNDSVSDDELSLEVDVRAIDSVEGLLSVSVTEHYTNVGGSVGSIKKDVTIIIDEEISRPIVKLDYIANGRLYREYQLKKGNEVIIPQVDNIDSQTLAYWVDNEGNRLSEGMIADDDRTYNAVFV